ncbi:MAG: rsxB [Gammaproteobacteria bacterium]|jgi:electron transport complex protein RnfB|nr:rsxB [Gammaproteobacteria bacterium]
MTHSSNQPNQNPHHSGGGFLAKIRETECIGCTKCFKACPVDAIFGALNQMHTVIAAECIGCELCIEPCPVDCIDLIPVESLEFDKLKARNRAKAKLERGDFQRAGKLALAEKALAALPAPNLSSEDKKKYINDAVARAKAKKNQP